MRARHLYALAGITIAGALLRFTTLDVQSYWLDEVATVNILHKGFGSMLSAVASGESTPPLYYIVAWVWAKVFGTGEVGLRSLSALFGTATIPVAFELARRAASERAGLIAAALAAFNPLLVWYSQEARSYALMVLLTGLSLIVFVRLLSEPSARRFGSWALLAVASLATHYYSGFLLGAEALWLVWRFRRRAEALAAVGALVVAAAALLPLALHQSSTGAAGFISASPVPRRLAQIPKQFAVGYHGPAEIACTIATLLLAAYGIAQLVAASRSRIRSRRPRAARADSATAGGPAPRAAVADSATAGGPDPRAALADSASAAGPDAARRALRHDADRALLLAALGVAAVAGAFVLAVIGPDYLIARNVIASWLPIAAAVAIGLAGARGGIAATAVICAIGLLMIIAVDTNERYQRDDWRGAAKFIGKPDQPRAIVVTPAAGRTPLLYYLRGSRPMPPAGVHVNEVVFVGLGARDPGQAPQPPRPAQVAFANFTETTRKQADTYTVVVEHSPVGADIAPQIGASPLDSQPALTIFQP